MSEQCVYSAFHEATWDKWTSNSLSDSLLFSARHEKHCMLLLGEHLYCMPLYDFKKNNPTYVVHCPCGALHPIAADWGLSVGNFTSVTIAFIQLTSSSALLSQAVQHLPRISCGWHLDVFVWMGVGVDFWPAAMSDTVRRSLHDWNVFEMVMHIAVVVQEELQKQVFFAYCRNEIPRWTRMESSITVRILFPLRTAAICRRRAWKVQSKRLQRGRNGSNTRWTTVSDATQRIRIIALSH